MNYVQFRPRGISRGLGRLFVDVLETLFEKVKIPGRK